MLFSIFDEYPFSYRVGFGYRKSFIQVHDLDSKDDDTEDDDDDDDDDVDVKVMTILHDRAMYFFHVSKSRFYCKIFNTR